MVGPCTDSHPGAERYNVLKQTGQPAKASDSACLIQRGDEASAFVPPSLEERCLWRRINPLLRSET